MIYSYYKDIGNHYSRARIRIVKMTTAIYLVPVFFLYLSDYHEFLYDMSKRYRYMSNEVVHIPGEWLSDVSPVNNSDS